MKVIETQLDGVFLIKPDIFEDFRGDYVMVYNDNLYAKEIYDRTGISIRFVEHDISTSTKGVLRGIHYDPKCWKINQCLYGRIYHVVVDCDVESPTFGKWQAFILSDRNRYQLLKHPRYGNSFLVLSDYAVFMYYQSEYYDPARQKTFLWNDPRFNIWWPIKNPIVSQRDEEGHYV